MPTTPTSQGPSAADPLDRARQMIDAGRLDEAEPLCNARLKENADDADALYMLGWIDMCKGSAQAAAERMKRVIEVDPNHARAHNNLGALLLATGDAKAAAGHFEAALANEPGLAEAHGNLASIHMREGRLDQAEAGFAKALELDPGNASTLNNMGALKLSRGQDEEAIALFEKAVAANPKFTQGYNSLANGLRRAGRRDEAIAALERGVAAVPGSLALITNLGILRYEGGDLNAALTEFDRAGKLAPDNPRPRFLSAFALLAKGRLAEGFAAYLHRPSVAKLGAGLTRDALAADLSGTTVAIESEGSINEDLVILRFAAEVKRRGARVVCAPHAALVGPLRRVAEIDEVLEGGPAPAGALRVAVGDLPHVLGVETPADICAPLALTADPARIEAVAKRLEALGPGPYTGLDWRPAAQPSVAGSKPLPLEALGAALAGAGGTVVAIQARAGAEEMAALARGLGREVHPLSDAMADTEDALALMAVLDRLVSLPDATVPLRLAVGRTADVLLPAITDYRFPPGAPSPWFPGCAVHREDGAGWDSALRSLAESLGAPGG